MKILRKGARADHGMKSVELKPAKVEWNRTSDTFDLTFSHAATDFNTEARHKYKIRSSAMEQAAQLTMLAAAATLMDRDEFITAFAPALPALFKLQAMAIGVKVAA